MSPAGESPLQALVDSRLVFTDLKATTLEEALSEMARGLAAAGVVRDAQDLARRLLERERLGCTGLGSGIAIPHCKLKDVSRITLAIGSSCGGVDFRAPDGAPVTLIFLILSPADAPALHLQALARISRLLRTPGVADNLRRASTAEQILEAVKEAEASLTVTRA